MSGDPKCRAPPTPLRQRSVEARGIDETEDRVSANPSPQKSQAIPIRAGLIGDHTCTAGGLTVRASAPVLALCRELVATGQDPTIPLEVWRCETLCLRVRSIGEAAWLRVATHGVGFETLLESTGASPVRKNETRRPEGYAVSPITFGMSPCAVRGRPHATTFITKGRV
jgi:hypothetical protein